MIRGGTVMIVVQPFRPGAGRKSPSLACSLAALLMTSVAMPAFADASATTQSVQDLGEVAPTTPMTATVWLKAHDQAAFDTAVASLYDQTSSSYHHWMSTATLAGYGPQAADIAAVQKSLQGMGLKIEHISENGSAIKVSGSAATMQAAFGTAIHAKQSGDVTFLANVATPQYRGSNPELVGAVSGLSSAGVQPFLRRQVDLSTGLPKAGVPAAQATTGPLAAFTSNCFGPDITATLSGIAFSVGGPSGAVNATFTGPSYLNPTTTNRPNCGYTAKQIAAHYGLEAAYALGLSGKGQTIVIVDAYGSGTITADAN